MRPNENKTILLTVLISVLLLCAVLVPIKNEVSKTLPPLQGLTYSDLTEDQKREFNECSLNEGDLGCDSCLQMIIKKYNFK